MARGDQNYDKVVRKHNKGKTKSKARIAAVHTMVESMIQGNTAAAGDAFNTYMKIASREILLGEGDEELEDDESEMTDDDNDESEDDTSMADDDSDDDSDEDSDDGDEDSDSDDDDDSDDSDDDGETDDDVEVSIRQKMDEGKKGVNPFAKKGKKHKDDDKDTGGDKFEDKKERDRGLKSKPRDLSGDSKNARSTRRGGKGKK